MIATQLTVPILICSALQLVTARNGNATGDGYPSRLDGDELIDGIPTRGVVPIRFENNTDEELDAQWNVVVRDGDGDLVEGATEVTFDRLVWRSSTPLAPLTEYDAEITYFLGRETVKFRTAADDTTPTIAPVFAPLNLAESFAAKRSVCCDIVVDGEDDCFSGDRYRCVGLTFKPAIRVGSRDLAEATTQRYITRRLDTPFRRLLEPDPNASEYCIDVALRNLLDESTETYTICADAGDVVPSQGPMPSPTLDEICEGPAVDAETGEPVSDGGCSLAGGQSGSGKLLLFLLLVGIGLRRPRNDVRRVC